MSDPETKPIQGGDAHGRGQGQVRSEIYMRAYEVYCEVWGEQPALIEGWCRGGFGKSELVAFLRPVPRRWAMPDAEAKKMLIDTARGLVLVKPKATGNDVAAACWHVATSLLADGKADDALVFMRVASTTMNDEVMRQILSQPRPRWRG